MLSHGFVLAQIESKLSSGTTLVQVSDTALACEKVKAAADPSHAAVGPREAAESNGLTVLGDLGAPYSMR